MPFTTMRQLVKLVSRDTSKFDEKNLKPCGISAIGEDDRAIDKRRLIGCLMTYSSRKKSPLAQ